MTQRPKICNTGLVTMAEKDLAAFARAVSELFGSEHAQQSDEDWIEELERMDTPAGQQRQIGVI